MVITIAGGGSTFTAGIVKSIALRREELEVDEIRLFDKMCIRDRLNPLRHRWRQSFSLLLIL